MLGAVGALVVFGLTAPFTPESKAQSLQEELARKSHREKTLGVANS